MQNIAKVGKITSLKICCADLDAAIFRERHYCPENASIFDANFCLVASNVHKTAQKRILVAVANFDRFPGREKMVFPHVDTHTIVRGFLRVKNGLIVSVHNVKQISWKFARAQSCRQCVVPCCCLGFLSLGGILKQ
jgi:hypothetical protein